MKSVEFNTYRAPSILIDNLNDEEFSFPGIYPDKHTDDMENLIDPYDLVIEAPSITVMCCQYHKWTICASNIDKGFYRNELARKLCNTYKNLHPQKPCLNKLIYYINTIKRYIFPSGEHVYCIKLLKTM